MCRSCGRASLALLSPWPLIEFTLWSVQLILPVQLAVFHRRRAGAVAGRRCGSRWCRAPCKRARAHHAALEQFVDPPHRRNQEPLRRAHLRVAGGALCPHHRRRRHRDESAGGRMAGRDRRADGPHAAPAASPQALSPPSSAAATSSPPTRRPTARRTNCRTGFM